MEPQGPARASRVVDALELSDREYRDVELPFELTRPAVLDFPIEYRGGIPVQIDRLTVIPDHALEGPAARRRADHRSR